MKRMLVFGLALLLCGGALGQEKEGLWQRIKRDVKQGAREGAGLAPAERRPAGPPPAGDTTRPMPNAARTGKWLSPAKGDDKQAVRTSIGTLAVTPRDDVMSVLSLDGRPLRVSADASEPDEFETMGLSLERVIDYGGDVTLFYSAGCGGTSYECRNPDTVAAHLDGRGRMTSVATAGGEPDQWHPRDGMLVQVLGRTGARVREAQLAPEFVRVIERAPEAGELARLHASEQRAAEDSCEDLYASLNEGCPTADRDSCAQVDPDDPSSVALLLGNASTPWYQIAKGIGRVDRFAALCRSACETRRPIDRKSFVAAICQARP